MTSAPLDDPPALPSVTRVDRGSWSLVTTLARHEYRAAVRSRVLLALLAILIVTTTASIYIAAVDYRSQLADYNAYVNAARSSGIQQIAPSPLQLLSLLRGAMEYIEIIGAIIGITLGYLTVSRERSSGTLPLLRSRPVTTGQLAAGSALGALALVTTLVAVTAVVGVVGLGAIGNDWIDGVQALKLVLASVAAVVYMMTFYCLGVVCTARARVAANGLMVALGIWLVVVLVIPQIGDTLDADNQVPGGLFAALGLDKSGEDHVLAHFSTYETVRTTIESTSVAKHFERFAFAMTDVKEKYRGFSLGHLLALKHSEIEWLLFFIVALGVAFFRSFRRQPSTAQGEHP
jgi:ABC-2 type transport system permease protein